MERWTTEDLLDLSKSIAAEIFAEKTHPWEVLPLIGDFTRSLGASLSPELFDHPSDDVWIAKSARIFPSAYIAGPCVIDEGAEVRHCAFIRGSAIIGKNAVVGNSTEIKNAILFDGAQVPHYNYIGDSVLGFKAHMGAGAITSNVKADKSLTVVCTPEQKWETGMKKFGAIVGDYGEIGCNSVLNPATIIGRNANVYPLSMVRGVVPQNSIYKRRGEVVERIKIK